MKKNVILKTIWRKLSKFVKNVGMKEWEWAGLEEIMSKDGE